MAETVGKYELVQKLAVGGMAEVFLARTAGPAGFNKSVVVKRILPHLAQNPDFVTMFLNEARLAAALDHANVVQIFELGQEDGGYYIAMEYVDGPNLRALNKAALLAGERIPTSVTTKVISLACEGLAYAHEYVDGAGVPQKLVHRDISPHNILLSRSGTVKVADFGIAKAASIPSVTRPGQMKGKLKYMPPEQLRDEPLDQRADIWAMGVTLYELLTGTRPFDGPTEAAVIVAIAHRPPRPLADFGVDSPELLQPILERALAKDRADRYPDARSLQADLEAGLMRSRTVVRGLEVAEVVRRFLPSTGSPPPRSGASEVPSGARVLSRANTPPADPETQRERKLSDFGLKSEPPASGPDSTRVEPRPSAPILAPGSSDGAASGQTAQVDLGDALQQLAAPEMGPPRASIGIPRWVQTHPIEAGLTLGGAVAVAILSAMYVQYRELRTESQLEQSLSGPLAGATAVLEPAKEDGDQPALKTAHATVVTVPEERKVRDAIDEPGGGVLAKAQGEKEAAAKGLPAPPPPQRHIGPQMISYGYMDLQVMALCNVKIDFNPVGDTPLKIPLQVGVHRVDLHCGRINHDEVFNVQATAGMTLEAKTDLKGGATVAGSFVAKRR